MRELLDPEYLGDGVYAALEDTGMIRLTTGNHDLRQADAAIFLEPPVMTALEEFAARKRKQYAEATRLG